MTRGRVKVLDVPHICSNFVIGHDAIRRLPAALAREQISRIGVVADATAWELHGGMVRDVLASSGTRFHTTFAPVTDGGKTLGALEPIVDDVLEHRPQAIVSFGGGIAMNVAGVVAALAYRGVPLFQVPTTLAGMVDVGPSIRHSVHSRVLRKGVGLFLKPRAVFCDVGLIATTSRRARFDGIVEATKTALVEPRAQALTVVAQHIDSAGRDDVDWARFVEIAVRSKAHAMRRDPSERRQGMCLHYGHTVGLALEPLAPILTHGEAVVYGMDAAARIAHRLQLMSGAAFDRHQTIIAQLLRHTSATPPIDITALLHRLSHDAKAVLHVADDRGLPFVLLRDLGRLALNSASPFVVVSTQVARDVLSEAMPGWNQQE